MMAYLEIVRRVLGTGERKQNRTGVDAITVAGAMFEHDMADGFPLVTTKRMPFKSIAVELEFFIRGLTDKRWLQERGCAIWDEWCSPEKVEYGHDEETKKRMREERDLGPIYGFIWRHWGQAYYGPDYPYGRAGIRESNAGGFDQLKELVYKLKNKPDDRRMIVTAWDPSQVYKAALPPCHYGFQCTVVGGKLNLLWNQRSVDTMLGLPFNIASYGLLLHLLAKTAGLREGRLIGFLADTHVYVNHVEAAREQLAREPKPPPKVETRSRSAVDFDIFDWEHADTAVGPYDCHEKIHFPVAV